MRSKQMLMGVAVIGFVAAAMASGAYAQGTGDASGQFNARTGDQRQPSNSGQLNARTSGQQPSTMRERQSAQPGEQLNARTNRAPSTGQMERRGSAYGRTHPSMREGRGFAETRGMLSAERSTYARISEGRYGHGLLRGRGYTGYERDFRGGRGSYARAGAGGAYAYRGGRFAYSGRSLGVDASADPAAADYGYRPRRLYAYAPGYSVGYTATPSYAPTYLGVEGLYAAPAWNLAYASPPYGYAGPGVGIGIGPVGVGFGPAWGW